MRFVTLLAFIIFSFAKLYAQENQTLLINPARENEEELTKQIFKYPAYQNGTAFFKENATAQALMNYNRLFNQVLFIGPKGDTMTLAHPETFEKIVIGVDTFYYYEDGFVEKLTHFNGVNLARKQSIKYIGKETKGAYGSYSVTAATDALAYYSADQRPLTKMILDENAIYKFTNTYYLSDRFTNYFPATRKGFSDMFPNREKQLKEFIDTNKINFKKEKDLLKLMAYMQGL